LFGGATFVLRRFAANRLAAIFGAEYYVDVIPGEGDVSPLPLR
jgi:hypothetical protein